MLQSLMQYKLAVLACVFCLLLALEHLFPFLRNSFRLARYLKNLALAGVNFVLSPLIVIPLTSLAAQYSLGWRPEAWTGITTILVDLVVLDIWIYWWHRVNHLLPFLWRWHEVHHLDETLDTSTALRFHFGEVLLSSVVRAAVIIVLAIPLTTVVLFETFIMAASLFHHSNIKLPEKFERILAPVIVTPSLHWVHHHAKRSDTDSNYATVFSFWDILFGSRSPTTRADGIKIGVEGQSDKSWRGLILRPFRNTKQ